MSYSNLIVERPYEHLIDDIEHVVLYGQAKHLREGDIVLDGLYYARKISSGQHDGHQSIAIQLAPIDTPGVSVGRLVIAEYMEITFARPVKSESWDPQTTDEVPDLKYDESTGVVTRDLMPGDYVGWIDGDPLDERSQCRVRCVKRIYRNGLIEFEDGAYQSSPSASWYVLNVDSAENREALSCVTT